MEIIRATPELIETPIIQQILPIENRTDLIDRIQEGIIMNMIVEDGVPVGFVGLTGEFGNNLMAVIHQDFRRRGYVYETCLQTITEGFEDSGINEINASVVQNSPSHQLAIKLGLIEQRIERTSQMTEVYLSIRIN
jgi:RimJ/RimL family protein N-acetyltransferase